MALMLISSGYRQLVADSEGVVHSGLGESHVIGVRRYPHSVTTTINTGGGRGGADGGVLRLLAQIYIGTADGGTPHAWRAFIPSHEQYPSRSDVI